MAEPPLSGPSETERNRAFERFQLLRPSLEEGIPLARVARDRGLALRTARRWIALYRREGLAGLARKGRTLPEAWRTSGGAFNGPGTPGSGPEGKRSGIRGYPLAAAVISPPVCRPDPGAYFCLT